VRVVRVCDDSGRDGNEYRVLVDRPWPRGQSKDRVDHDEWDKGVAPSTELRRWYRHDPKHFAEFSRRYRAELRETNKVRSLVLLTAMRDVEHSGATVRRSAMPQGVAPALISMF
jgi:uncharacterized protein YeaO (DUF488 family)